jgi:hypothetical protein
MPDLGFDEMDLHDEHGVKLSRLVPGEKFKFFYPGKITRPMNGKVGKTSK